MLLAQWPGVAGRERVGGTNVTMLPGYAVLRAVWAAGGVFGVQDVFGVVEGHDPSVPAWAVRFVRPRPFGFLVAARCTSPDLDRLS